MSFKAAEWSTATVNDFPDSSFAYIEPGGKKDSEGKTVPRSLRHLPYKDKDGKPDLPHVRNALARLSQTQNIPAQKRTEIRNMLEKILQRQQPKKSLLEDWQGFHAWQEALYESRGKRIPTV